MNLEIRRDTIYWYIKAIYLQELIFVLNKEGNYWSTNVCLTKKKRDYYLLLRIFLNPNDEDEFNITDSCFTISISEDTFSLLQEYNLLLTKYGTPFSHELNDLFFIQSGKWFSCYIYIEND